MTAAQRKLSELQALAYARREGLSIGYTGHNPTIIDGIIHPWVVMVGRIGTEFWTGYGMTMWQAVENCYDAWQKDTRVWGKK